MSNPTVSATVLFAVFAFGFIGVMLAAAFLIDRRRVKDVHDAIPDRIATAFEQQARSTAEPEHDPEVHTAAEYEAKRDHEHRHGAA